MFSPPIGNTYIFSSKGAENFKLRLLNGEGTDHILTCLVLIHPPCTEVPAVSFDLTDWMLLYDKYQTKHTSSILEIYSVINTEYNTPQHRAFYCMIIS